MNQPRGSPESVGKVDHSSARHPTTFYIAGQYIVRVMIHMYICICIYIYIYTHHIARHPRFQKDKSIEKTVTQVPKSKRANWPLQ